ncbi:Fe-S cluster assembly factor NUBPL [Hamiltosporidium tvaerminnensis]|uniref:Fe-S cluster assembly factor NUBPL n=1 Tax=Hamiltosporidium tvaerminnensis TaxID=1176355 RepID=A0A4Q9M195_9MICR|nr:Fe-S cluster assembly factor NUBPL [Hamiltosporidium tvaerminnensis]
MSIPTDCSLKGCDSCPKRSICTSKVEKTEIKNKIKENMKNVKFSMAVMSGKGGVGKSTVCRGICGELVSKGYVVFVVDMDISSPSVPRIIGSLDLIGNNYFKDKNINTDRGIESNTNRDNIIDRDIDNNTDRDIDRAFKDNNGIDRDIDNNNTDRDIDINTNPPLTPNTCTNKYTKDFKDNTVEAFEEMVITYDKIYPVKINENLFCISAGYIEDINYYNYDMKSMYVQKVLSNTVFIPDCIVIFDMPPGTTDEHLSLLECIEELPVIFVSMPSKICVSDVIRQIGLCKKMKCNILGIIENMNVIECKCCGKVLVSEKDNVVRMCEEQGIPYIGSIKYNQQICFESDRGNCVEDLLFVNATKYILNEIEIRK